MRAVVLVAALTAMPSLREGGLYAQTSHFNDSLLPIVRRAAAMVPGPLPQSVRVVQLNPFRREISTLVDGGPPDTVMGTYPVFQVKYERGWVVVDAALDREFVPNSRTFSDDDYAQIHLALRDAKAVVVTHEHHDHVAGVLRSPYLAQVQQHTLLTKAQIRTMMERPNNPRIKIDSATAARYVVTDYDTLFPLAPGVVLIKAAGHSPGSQLVYVRTTSGNELIIAGDVAWHMSGISGVQQKPLPISQDIGEDRTVIPEQLRWLKEMSERLTVLVSHDMAHLNELIARGIIVAGFDLNNP